MTDSQSLLACYVWTTILVMCLPSGSLAEGHPAIDPDIPAYVSRTSVSGKLVISVSEAMKPLVESWADDLIRQHPDLTVSVVLEDNHAYLAALFERRVEVTAMSRRMTPTELTDFILEFGYEPIEVPVARHASIVFVQNDSLNAEALRSQFVETPGSASVRLDERMNQYGIRLSPTDHTISMAQPLLTASRMDGRYATLLALRKVGRVRPSERIHYLYITRPSSSNPSRTSTELVRYALSRQGQQLALALGHLPLSFEEVSRVTSRWPTASR